MPLFQRFDPVIHDMVEDEKGNKVIMWVSSSGDTDIGPYGNEYMILLYFNEAGDKVERFVEFVDSRYAMKFYGRLAKHMAEKAAQNTLAKL